MERASIALTCKDISFFLFRIIEFHVQIRQYGLDASKGSKKLLNGYNTQKSHTQHATLLSVC